MANILSKARQSLADAFAETPTVSKIYVIMVPMLATIAAAARATENYMFGHSTSTTTHDPSNTLAAMALISTLLNVIVGAAAIRHYRQHDRAIHFDNCERSYCFGSFANRFERVSNFFNGAENGG